MASSTRPGDQRVDLEHYEGVKAYQITFAREDGKMADGTSITNDTIAFSAKDCSDNSCVHANPLFIKRGTTGKYTSNGNYKASFMMDGREDPSAVIPDAGIASTAVAQTVDLLKCIKCTGAVELGASPTKSKDINLDCWNPAGSNIATDISTFCFNELIVIFIF